MIPRAVMWVALAGAFLAPSGASGAEALVAVATNFAGATTALESAFERDGAHRIRVATGSTGALYAQVTRAPRSISCWRPTAPAPNASKRQAMPHPDRAAPTRSDVSCCGARTCTRDQRRRTDAARSDVPKACDRESRTCPVRASGARHAAGARTLRGAAQAHRHGRERRAGPRAGRHGQCRAGPRGAVPGHASRARRSRQPLGRAAAPPHPHPADAVLLRHGAQNPAAAAFLRFLFGPGARDIIEAHGYRLPPADAPPVPGEPG